MMIAPPKGSGTAQGGRQILNLSENMCSTRGRKIFYKRPTCDDHRGFSLYVLLFPRPFVKLLLAQGHLVCLDVSTLRVLKEKPQTVTCANDISSLAETPASCRCSPPCPPLFSLPQTAHGTQHPPQHSPQLDPYLNNL